MSILTPAIFGFEDDDVHHHPREGEEFAKKNRVVALMEEGRVDEDAGTTLVAGDIVAMKFKGMGGLGFIKAATAANITVIPIKQQVDGIWVKCGPARAAQSSVLTKIPAMISEMRIRI